MSNKPSDKPFTPDELKKIVAVLSLAYFEAKRSNSDHDYNDTSLSEYIRYANDDLGFSQIQSACINICVEAYLEWYNRDIRGILAHNAYDASQLLERGLKAAISALREYRYEEEEAIINSPIGD